MSELGYCTEDDVYAETGLDTAIIQTLGGIAVGAVTTLINNMISDIEEEINDLMNVPAIIHRELHCGTGEDDEFDLGSFDELGFYDDYDPAGNIVTGFAAWFWETRKKRPWPEVTADQTESIAASMTGTNCAIADESTAGLFVAGANSTRLIYSAAGMARYPTARNLNKNIDIYEFVSMRFRSTSSAVTFTLRLYDRTGTNYNSIEFTVDRADIWYIIHFSLVSDTWAGLIDWDDTRLYSWEIWADGACTAYVDNFNFNDGWFFTAPQGKLVIPHMISEEPVPEGYPIYISYTYNPMLASVPRHIKKATACLTGVTLINWCIGRRQRNTAFLIQSDTLVRAPDKETLYFTRSYLQKQADKALAAFGYSYEFVPVAV